MSNSFAIETRCKFGMSGGNHLNDIVKVTMAIML